MNHKRPPLPAIFVLILIIGFSIYFIATQTTQDENGTLTASGTIEATQVDIAPELAGKVTDVLVEEGQPVTKDSALLFLDPSLLTAQRAVASAQVDSANAALASAQTKYDQTLEAAIAAQVGQRAADWRASSPSEFDQPNWYIEQSAQITASQAELHSAQAAITDAQTYLDTVLNSVDNADFVNAENRLAEARIAFLVAKDVKAQADAASQSGGLSDAASDYYDAAVDELEDAQEDYDDLLDTDAAENIEYARGRVFVAEQRYDAAYARLLALQTGENSPAVIAAKNTVDQAQKTVAQAEASLALVEAQIAKLTVNAPMDGVILTRNVEPGEFIQPGAVALKLADLNNLTITVYVPEDRYGEIMLGQIAEVTVDSFPNEIFTAVVIHISDKAEFTPRNVQTVEGRSSTVYAIKLKVENAGGKLKIGMPADVTFAR
ncbi:MAG: HlyD family efflux transporter periplasmic adaptor subunit [Chloroflexi bacterium]|nr:HlyD family efflux transporter periplasmic adaptor subunit [Chloroflexota bacterium]